jgi:hypothetical protein
MNGVGDPRMETVPGRRVRAALVEMLARGSTARRWNRRDVTFRRNRHRCPFAGFHGTLSTSGA